MAVVIISPQDEDKVKQAVLDKLKDWIEEYSIEELERIACDIVEAIKEA